MKLINSTKTRRLSQKFSLAKFSFPAPHVQGEAEREETANSFRSYVYHNSTLEKGMKDTETVFQREYFFEL